MNLTYYLSMIYINQFNFYNILQKHVLKKMLENIKSQKSTVVKKTHNQSYNEVSFSI
jgi:hypothetical protein